MTTCFVGWIISTTKSELGFEFCSDQYSAR